MTMLLRQKTGFWADAEEPQGEAVGIDAGLRAYSRSFAAPLIALTLLLAALVMAVAFTQPA